MTELEIMQRAKTYLDKLANGIDPLTDAPVPENDCVNQVRISRCLFYVSDVLRKLIENGGFAERPRRAQKAKFSLTPEQLKGYRFDDVPIPVSEITKRLNELVDHDATVKLKYRSITYFLIQSGFLKERQSTDGRSIKEPTEQGRALGISEVERNGVSGPYRVILYDADAQRFILDHIDAISELNASLTPSAETGPQPWTAEQDASLKDMFDQNVPIYEMASALKRTQGAVRARLKKLGLRIE